MSLVFTAPTICFKSNFLTSNFIHSLLPSHHPSVWIADTTTCLLVLFFDIWFIILAKRIFWNKIYYLGIKELLLFSYHHYVLVNHLLSALSCSPSPSSFLSHSNSGSSINPILKAAISTTNISSFMSRYNDPVAPS